MSGVFNRVVASITLRAAFGRGGRCCSRSRR